jgi:hypothetical protein
LKNRHGANRVISFSDLPYLVMCVAAIGAFSRNQFGLVDVTPSLIALGDLVAPNKRLDLSRLERRLPSSNKKKERKRKTWIFFYCNVVNIPIRH